MPKTIHLIVACSANRAIGLDGHLPWNLPEDTAYFQKKTRGHTVILGRRSLEDWVDADHGRDVIEVTSAVRAPRRADPVSGRGAYACATSLSDAVNAAENFRGDIFLCGGQKIYEEGIALTTGSLFLTLIYAHFAGDAYFPDWREHFTREISRVESSEGKVRYSFLELARER